jgi:hypothetical protein
VEIAVVTKESLEAMPRAAGEAAFSSAMATLPARQRQVLPCTSFWSIMFYPMLFSARHTCVLVLLLGEASCSKCTVVAPMSCTYVSQPGVEPHNLRRRGWRCRASLHPRVPPRTATPGTGVPRSSEPPPPPNDHHRALGIFLLQGGAVSYE